MHRLPSRPSLPLRRLALLPVGVLALGGVAACGSSSTSQAGGDESGSGGVAHVGITMVSGAGGDSCQLDTTSVPAGPVTFSVKNESATGINELELQSDQRIIGEKENLAPGLAPVSFTLTLGGGDYQVYCPGATKEMQNVTVTGAAATSAASSTQQLLQQGAKQYGDYVDTQVAAMGTAATALDRAVKSGDLKQSQIDYADARIYYERIESDVEGFVLPGFKATDNRGNLDYLIDMRASNLDPAVGWSGFHAVERDLFGRQKITAQTKRYAATLDQNIAKLSALVKKLSYRPEDLANGAAGLLEEVQSSKISGEEEAFSHIDLVDFAGDLEGAQQCFANLEPGLKKIDPTLTAMIGQRFDAVEKLLDGFRDPHSLGGYVRYTAAVRQKNANTLSQTVQSLQDSLSRLAEKVATA